MKKISKILLPTLLILPLFGGCAVKNYTNEEVKVVKEWVNALQEGIKNNSNKGYTASIKEKYNVDYVIDNQNEKTDFSLDYEAEGSLVFAYQIEDDYQGDVNLGNIFKDGRGYFSGAQKEKSNYYSKTVKKGEESDPIIAELDYDIDHKYAFKYDEANLYASAHNKFVDNKDHTKDIDGEFKAEVKKEYVDDTGAMYIEKLMNDVLFLNVWTSINEFATITNLFYEGLSFANDEEVKDFMRSLNIKIKENDKDVEISFFLDVDKVIYRKTGQESHLNALIPSKNILNKETNSVSFYSYDFVDVLKSTLNQGSRGKSQFNATVERFFIEGYMVKFNEVDQAVEGPFVIYDQSNMNDFYTGFNQYVIPYKVV